MFNLPFELYSREGNGTLILLNKPNTVFSKPDFVLILVRSASKESNQFFVRLISALS